MNKYRKGHPIFDMSNLCQRLKKGEWVYYGDKVMHPGFIISMPLRTVMIAMDKWLISEAIDQHQERYRKLAESKRCQ